MRNSLAVAAAVAVLASSAMAQTQTQNPPAQDSPQNSAINSQDSSNRQVNAPVAGVNSFTEGQARSRIEKMGFADVTGLKRDDNGVWRGRAMKGGQMVDVSVDYQGNVIQAGTQGTTVPSNTVSGAPRR
jgi:opacity protein-like surface antigen